MSLFDYYNAKIPDYYDGMYKDGYTPEQILYAKHRQMREDYEEETSEQDATELVIRSEVKSNQ